MKLEEIGLEVIGGQNLFIWGHLVLNENIVHLYVIIIVAVCVYICYSYVVLYSLSYYLSLQSKNLRSEEEPHLLQLGLL